MSNKFSSEVFQDYTILSKIIFNISIKHVWGVLRNDYYLN